MPLKTVKVPPEMEPLFAKAEEVVGLYFDRRENDPTKGTIRIFGERYVLVRAASLSVEFFALVEGLYGPERKAEARRFAQNILFDLSHAIGRSDARLFHGKMDLKEPLDRLSAGPVHFAYSGWASVDIFPESRPSPDEDYFLIYDHPYSFESAAWIQAGRAADFPVCIMNAGYSSGWCEESFGVALVASEILCRARGDDCCRFIMAPLGRIDGHIARYASSRPELAGRIRDCEIPDFFARKRAEEANENARAYAELLLATVPNSVFVVDRQRRVTTWNKKAEEVTGFSAADVLGKECTLFSEHPCREKCGLFAKDVPKPVLGKECTIRRKDGQQRVISKNVEALKDHEGNIVGGIECFEDITERKRAEEELKGAYIRLHEIQDELVQAEKLGVIGKMASGVAHEVRNPLGIIVQCTTYLQNNLPRKRKDISEVLTMLQEGVKRADNIVNRLLDFSREAGFDLKSEDVDTILEKSVELVDNQLKLENIEIVREIKAGLPPVWADRFRMEQVFINILLNAVQSMPKGGTITIRCYDEKLTGAETGTVRRKTANHFKTGETVVVVEFADTGTGIAPENLPKIFDPFFTTKSSAGGTGLGLSVTQNIVHMHKGLIFVESEVGRGTKTTVVLKTIMGGNHVVESEREKEDTGHR